MRLCTLMLRATYRVQFHTEFTFDHARALVPYFAQLGISHLYSSPILTARAGSHHGYDVVDHSKINPELGGEPAFRALVTALRSAGIGVLLDIVPNHMAVGGADNPFWLDMLEKGRESPFADMFDIDWDAGPSTLQDRIVVPTLGKPLGECLADREITLEWDARLAKLVFVYGDNRFPLRLDDYALVVHDAAPADADLSAFTNADALRSLLDRQHFRLTFWQDAGHRINWRRFFDITSLAALRVEDPAVFERTHAAIFRLFSEGLIDGVRVDHVDGLADPAAYCRRLRATLEALVPQRPESLPREPAIIVVEKILGDGEELPADWGVDGTTGYDFMNAVSAMQHDAANESPFTDLWTTTSGRPPDFEAEEVLARGQMLESAFTSALRFTATAFAELSGQSNLPNLERAIALIIQHFRAYRTYALGDAVEPAPGPFFDRALVVARRHAPNGVGAALDLVASVMRGERADAGASARDAVRRFNQLAAPVAAKAVEDTAFYRYGRLLSRNDVGFTPGVFAWSPARFHEEQCRHAERFPRTLLATATHDHKRGEDARARLAAVSELSGEWRREVAEWFRLADAFRPAQVAPGDEYQLYQTLVASWPLDLDASNADSLASFTDRILAWREKSLREAKLDTAWDRPNEKFETAHRELVRSLLAPSSPFLERLARFVRWLAPAGALNGLAATALRCLAPGVPDLYQGRELWDLSLVDPDNRRPVDFDLRRRLMACTNSPAALVNDWQSGAVKLALIVRLLALRAAEPDLLANGDYLPVESSDPRVLAFVRRSGEQRLIVAAARLSARAAIAAGRPLPSAEITWGVLRDAHAWQAREWRDVLGGGSASVRMSLDEPMFAGFPVAVLIAA